MTGTTETRERFVRAIAAQIPAERIAEIHFFAPIKQGGVESGVAVVVESAPAPSSEPPSEPSEQEAEPVSEQHAAARHAIHTAAYRLVLKGPDRGKWETNVTAEADAPLITAEAVVRGVQRRSGDVEDPERVEGDAIRERLAQVDAPVS